MRRTAPAHQPALETPEIGMLYMLQTAHEQACNDEEHQRTAHLCDNESAAEAMVARS
jgi:hypothetical protein